MGKKITTVSIDEDILRMAKKELPNLSIFVEDCLKSYLGYNNTNIKSIDENLRLIQKALLDIHIMSCKDSKMDIEEKYGLVEQNKAWNKLFGLWRNNQEISLDEYNEASKVLNVQTKVLKELFINLEFNVTGNDLIKCNDWSYAKKYL